WGSGSGLDGGGPGGVDGGARDAPAGEPMRGLAGVVVGDGSAAVAADAQAFARDFERAGLGHDAGLSDLSARVIEGEGADRNAGWVFAIFVEGGRQNQVLAGRQLLRRRYFLVVGS